jgi:5'-methylthioadenosine phosphorylase
MTEKNKVKAAIISGSGLESFGFPGKCKKLSVKTPYGKVVALKTELNGKTMVFISRHGARHDILPHEINYRANILALKQIGVSHIIATAAVGSLSTKLSPGSFCLMKDFIDASRTRPLTIFDRKRAFHADMSHPYDPELAALLGRSIKELTGKKPGKAVYVATDGPRFETAAEVKMYKKAGGDVVGMTGVPEVVYAKEIGIPYASFGIVTNYACGICKTPITLEDIVGSINKNRALIEKIILRAASKIGRGGL